jgi:hypothetical protein
MQDDANAGAPVRKNQVVRLIAYFVVLEAVMYSTRFLAQAMAGHPALDGLVKFSEIVGNSLDMTRQRDDTLVTVWSLLATVLLVLPIGWTYAITKPKEFFDQSLVQILIVMALVVCGMMMIIQDNFSRALALVGAVSAVRFRTNLKDPKDAVYVLISIGIGMGTGLAVYRVAGLLALSMCCVFLVLWKLKIGERPVGEAGFVEFKDEKKHKKDKKEKKEKKEKARHNDESPAGGVPELVAAAVPAEAETSKASEIG